MHTEHMPDGRTIFTYIWDEFDQLVRRLIHSIGESNYRPDRVIGIMNGGMFPAVMIAKYFGVHTAAMAVQSYEEGESGICDQQGKVRFGRDLASVDYDFSGRVLLVDDLDDSGITMKFSAEWLRDTFKGSMGEITTATVWHKTCSVVVPDFYVETVEPAGNGKYPWIIQPFERLENQGKE